MGPDTRFDPGLWKRVGVNSGWLLAGRLFTQLQLALFTVLVARNLGAAGFGQYSYITALVFLGNVLTTFGTDTLLIRELARTRRGSDDRITAVLLLQFALTGIFIAGMFLWLALFPQQRSAEMLNGLRLYVLVLVPLAFYSVFSAVLRAWERMDLYLISNLVTAGLQLLLAWFALQRESGIIPLLYLLLAAQAAGAVIAGGLCWAAVPGFRPFGRVDRSRVVRVLRMAWPLALLSVLGVAYQRVGVLALSSIAGDAPTGWFSAASRIVEGVKLAHIAVLGAIFPAISHLSSGRLENQEQAGSLFKAAFWILLGFASVEIFVTWILARWGVQFLFGASYVPAVPLLRILIWTLIPYTVTSSLSLRLITRGRERSALAASAVGLAIAVGLNVWLIQARGLDGAGLAAVASECCLALIFGLLR